MSRISSFLHTGPRAAARWLGTVALLALAGPASAGPISANWNGLYVGGHGGIGWADLGAAALGDFEYKEGLGGAHLGYNLGLGRFVAGIEADASWTGGNGSASTAGGGAIEVSSGWHGTVRGRFGIGLGTALLYATAGYAWSETTITETTAAGTTSSTDARFDGVVYGIGAETYITPNITLRLEGLRYDYGTTDLSWSGGVGAIGDIDLGDTAVRAGLTWHFN